MDAVCGAGREGVAGGCAGGGPRVRHRHLAAGVRANPQRRKCVDARARRPARQAVIDDQDTSRSVLMRAASDTSFSVRSEAAMQALAPSLQNPSGDILQYVAAAESQLAEPGVLREH